MPATAKATNRQMTLPDLGTSPGESLSILGDGVAQQAQLGENIGEGGFNLWYSGSMKFRATYGIEQLRLYLDLCCFNRPYDDQSQTRIRLETEAKLIIQQKVRGGECELPWSSALDFENSRNPFEEHMHAIRGWRKLAVSCVMADAEVVKLAREAMAFGISEYDALHVGSAIVG